MVILVVSSVFSISIRSKHNNSFLLFKICFHLYFVLVQVGVWYKQRCANPWTLTWRIFIGSHNKQKAPCLLVFLHRIEFLCTLSVILFWWCCSSHCHWVWALVDVCGWISVTWLQLQASSPPDWSSTCDQDLHHTKLQPSCSERTPSWSSYIIMSCRIMCCSSPGSWRSLFLSF